MKIKAIASLFQRESRSRNVTYSGHCQIRFHLVIGLWVASAKTPMVGPGYCQLMFYLMVGL